MTPEKVRDLRRNWSKLLSDLYMEEDEHVLSRELGVRTHVDDRSNFVSASGGYNHVVVKIIVDHCGVANLAIGLNPLLSGELPQA
jgi:hypothetical protein